jgi:hypothetical protein
MKINMLLFLLTKSLSIVCLSSRKSSFVPTRTTGVSGLLCLISGDHFARTLSNEAGLTTL